MKLVTLSTTTAVLLLLANPVAAEDTRLKPASSTRTIEKTGKLRELSPPVSRTEKVDRQKLRRQLRSLEPADALAKEMAVLGRQLKGVQRGSEADRAAARATAARITERTRDLQRSFAKIGVAPAKGAGGVLSRLESTLADIIKELEAEDRLGNFDIQRLMSQYNQAEQLASQVQKKKDDTESAIIQKIG